MTRKGDIGFHGVVGEQGLPHSRREVDCLARRGSTFSLQYINQTRVDIKALQLADHEQAVNDCNLYGTCNFV